jgi:hypothetical protein
MERTAWTDARLVEKMRAIDTTFEELRASRVELRHEMADLRGEMRADFADLRIEIAGVRGEIGGIRSDLAAFQRHVTMIVGGLGVGLLGVISAFVATQL